MAVPDFQSFFLPLLKLSSDGETHSLKDAYVVMAENFKMSDADLQEVLPSGKQTTFKNRVAWVNVYLAKALLLERPKRGLVVKDVFEDAYNYMKSGTLMRQVINKISEIDFNTKKDHHTFGSIYEQILKNLKSAGNAGEFYTPRAVTQFVVDRVKVIITNPPFGGMEEDGIENNFPATFRTRETADLFMTLIIHLLATLTTVADPAEFALSWQRIAGHFDTLFTTEESIDQLKQTILQLAVRGKLVPPACRQAGKPPKTLPPPENGAWWIYVIECEDGSFYKGFTEDLPHL